MNDSTFLHLTVEKKKWKNKNTGEIRRLKRRDVWRRNILISPACCDEQTSRQPDRQTSLPGINCMKGGGISSCFKLYVLIKWRFVFVSNLSLLGVARHAPTLQRFPSPMVTDRHVAAIVPNKWESEGLIRRRQGWSAQGFSIFSLFLSLTAKSTELDCGSHLRSEDENVWHRV